MRILIIEDEINIREFLKTGLEAAMFVVDTAEDGDKGVLMATTNDYDLIILDNVMPKKNGFQVCAEIRGKGKSTPIIVLSVESFIGQKIAMLNAGADDYITKPFSFEELLARVRAILRRPKKFKEELLMIGDLVVDSVRQKVTRGKKEIYLTKKEFELLEYMMRNAGRVLSRNMIMEHVWDVDADPFSNTIESHILNLRKKIMNGDSGKLIYTIPGRGYKIDFKK